MSEENCIVLLLSKAEDADATGKVFATYRVSSQLQNFIIEASIKRDNLKIKKILKYV